jgi:hypothetical protein
VHSRLGCRRPGSIRSRTRGTGAVKRWTLEVLLRVVVVALVAGCKSLGQAEALTAEMSLAVRRRLGIARRVADTTMRDALCALDPDEVRRPLHARVRAAHRRKALEPDALPFGVVAMDGKATALPSCDDVYAQRQSQGEGAAVVGVVRTTTCTLISRRAMPCIDALPIPAATNEMGSFEPHLRSLVRAYHGLDLFRMVSYDAGACSEHNARVVHELGLHDLFGLKGTQPTLYAEAQRRLASLPQASATASTEDLLGGRRTVVRRVYLTEARKGFEDWTHLRTVLRVESETFDAKGHRLAHDNRYFVASLPASRLLGRQWLLLAPSPGRREQLPSHARHRLRGGRPTLDRERPARHGRRRPAATPRVQRADPVPLGHAALRRAASHVLARLTAPILQRLHLRHGRGPLRAAAPPARWRSLTSAFGL